MPALDVEAYYPSHGANWNDYLVHDGTDRLGATDTAACTGAETGYYHTACIHGGELRRVVILGISSCAGLSVTDVLGVFDWTCVEPGGVQYVYFYSTLRSSKGLRDLVDAGGWRPNQVLVSGVAAGASPSLAWWTNPVSPLPDNSATIVVEDLNAAGTVYYLESNRATAGYSVAADRISVVTLGASTLAHNGAVNDCVNGYIGTLCSNAGTLRRFVWIEVSLDNATTSEAGIAFVNTRYSRIYRTTSINGSIPGASRAMRFDGGAHSNYVSQVSLKNCCYGFRVDSSSYNTFEDITAQQMTGCGTSYGFCSVNGNHNVWRRITAADNGVYGIWFYATERNNYLEEIRLFNNGGPGIEMMSGCSENLLEAVIASNNADDGIYVEGDSNTFIRVDTFGNGANGIYTTGSSNVFHLVWSALNGADGIRIDGSNNLVGQVVATANTGYELEGSPANNQFVGNIAAEALDCFFDGDVTCNGTSASVHDPGTPVLSSVILGDIHALGLADTVNASDTQGGATHPTALTSFDWVHFDNPWRVWGSVSSPGRWSSGPGVIIDFRARTGGIIHDNTDAFSSPNPASRGGDCSAAAFGSEFIMLSDSMAYLTNAVEIRGGGNDNGLCESGETCLYTPSFGAYQGDGDLTPCGFQQNGGDVSGVSMFAYPVSGQ